MKGNLIIICSPSGGGKGTLIKEIRRTVPGLGYSVSYTTRQMREGEQNGREYFFVSRPEFEKRASSGDLLEYFEVHGNLYGTSVSMIDEITATGSDVILEIDVQGAEAVKRKKPDSVGIFILPPSFEVLRERLIARSTEHSESLALRLSNAFGEIEHSPRFDYVVINREIGQAAAELASIIIAERMRPDRQMDEIKGILDSFDRSKL